LQEKKELRYRLFKSEAERVGREVAVSSQAYETLLDYIFTENIGQMRKCIRASMANAMLESKAPAPAVLEIHLQHLPPYLLQSGAARQWEGDGKRAMLTLAQLQEQQNGEQRLCRFNSELLAQIGQMGDQSKSPEDFFASCRILLEQYLDDLYTDPQKEANPRRVLYSDLLKSICESVGKKLGLTFRATMYLISAVYPGAGYLRAAYKGASLVYNQFLVRDADLVGTEALSPATLLHLISSYSVYNSE